MNSASAVQAITHRFLRNCQAIDCAMDREQRQYGLFDNGRIIIGITL
jgi:hypothetical protein